MAYLGLIPARGGSKRVPEKNVRPLGGKPLVAWTIEAARASSRLERVVVSTESPTVAALARDWGAETPFERPARLATDTAPGVDVVLHALEWLASHEGYAPDACVLLQPTCPLRAGTHIDAAIDLFESRNADCVVAVSAPEHHPYWMKTMDNDGRLTPFMDVDLDRYYQKQQLPPVWASNSSIYVIRRTSFLERGRIYGGRTYGYVMPASDALDIDTAWDFHLAELVVADRKGVS